MAFLQNLIVTGSSKFLNKLYATDIEVSGTFGTSGNLSIGGTLDVTGNSTFGTIVTDKITNNGNLYNNGGIELSYATPYIDFHFNKSTADYTSRIIERASGILKIFSNLEIATSLTVPTTTITTANINSGNVTNLNVIDRLHATHFDLQSVAQLGGAFYVSPTVKFPTDSNTAFTITKSGSTLNITISDSALTSTTLAGVVWGAKAKIKASGKIGTVTTGTMDGTVTSINTSSHTLVISVSGENSGNVEAGSYTSTNIDNFCVMMYETADAHPVGIMMNSYGTDGRTYIDIHGGTATATTPNVRIGNLGGLSFNGTTLSNQWGIYTNNGYFSGSIVANGGKIGGFTIGSTAIYTGTLTANNDNNIGLSSADFTRTIGGTSRAGLRFAIGDKVGITGDGVFYGSNIQVSGGKIGGWNINTDYLYNYTPVTTGTASTQYGLRLVTGTAQTTQIIKAGSRSYDGTNYGSWTDNFYVRNDGYMFAKSGKIGGWTINSDNGLMYGGIGQANSVMLIPSGNGTAVSVGGSESISGWTITSGTNFGVTKTGALYCSDAHVTGEITATSGYIGNSTNGFTIDSSGFYSGTKTGNTSGYISLSNGNFTRTINNESVSNLRFAIGSKFGVTTDGTLYANGANINNINADNINMGTLSIERLSSLEIGGRNLVPYSKNLKSFTNENSSRVTVTYTEDSCTIENIYGNTRYGIYYDIDVEPNVTYTLSFYASNIAEGYTNYSVGNRTSGQTASWSDITGGYKQVVEGKTVCTFTIPDTVTLVRIYFCIGILNGTCTIKNVKLEKGNKATDWSPAPEDAQADIETALSRSSEYILGTQTAATGSWTGVSDTITELKDGTQIRYWLPYAGSGNATLNLTLKDGSTTGAIPIYRQGGSASSTGVVSAYRVTTHYPAGSSISMTYGVNRVISAVYNSKTYTGTFTGWFVDSTYDSGNTYNRVRMQNIIKAVTAITSGRIICGTSAGYKNIGANIAFDLTYPLLYASSGISANGTGDNNYLQINGINASYNGTITSGAAYKMLYLKGTVNNNTFTISASPFMTTVVPTTADNFIYIPLGIMYSTTNIYFISTDKLYAYKDGSFKELSRGEASLAAKTATNYLYYDSTHGLVISSSASSQTYSGASTGYNTRLTNTALEIRNGTNVLASYGSTVVLGKTGSSQQIIDATSMTFNSPTNETLFKIDSNVIGIGEKTFYDYLDIGTGKLTASTLSSKISSKLAEYNEEDGIYSKDSDYVQGATTSNTYVDVSIFGGYGETWHESNTQKVNVTNITVTDGLLNAKFVSTSTTSSTWTSLATAFLNQFPSNSTFDEVEIIFNFVYPVVAVAMTIGSRNEEGSTGMGSVTMGVNNNASGRYSYAFGRDLNAVDDYCLVVGESNQLVLDATTSEQEPMAFIVGANGTNAFGVSKTGTIFFSENNCGRVSNTTVGSNEKATVTITFPQRFPTAPFVVVSLVEAGALNNQTNINDYGKIQIYVHEVTQTELTVFIINNGSKSHNVEWSWFAFCTTPSN